MSGTFVAIFCYYSGTVIGIYLYALIGKWRGVPDDERIDPNDPWIFLVSPIAVTWFVFLFALYLLSVVTWVLCLPHIVLWKCYKWSKNWSKEFAAGYPNLSDENWRILELSEDEQKLLKHAKMLVFMIGKRAPTEIVAMEVVVIGRLAEKVYGPENIEKGRSTARLLQQIANDPEMQKHLDVMRALEGKTGEELKELLKN